MTTPAKTIEIKPENMAEIQKIEQKMINETRQLFYENHLLIKDLSDSIIGLLDDHINDSLERNAEKAMAIAYTISFICEQNNNIRNLDFHKGENHE